MDAMSTFFMIPRVTVDMPLPPAPARKVTVAGVMESYDPLTDTKTLKASPEDFENLRNHYSLRPEAPEAVANSLAD